MNPASGAAIVGNVYWILAGCRQFKFHKRGQLFIRSHNCRNLIRTLPAMVYDKTNPEDISPDCEEHAVKALTYGLTRRKMWGGMMKVKGL